MDEHLFLLAQDLNLHNSAARFDLSRGEERKRSADELAGFFFQAVSALQPDLFIEAGAKDARSSRRAADALESARVVAFEANPFTYQKFRKRNENNPRVEYLHLALSDSPGTARFNVRLTEEGKPRPDGHGSLLDRKEGYQHDFKSVTVEATTLDRHFADDGFSSCAIWMDVEGGTQAVLGGADRVLHRTSILILEVEDRPYWKGAWTMPDVTQFLFRYDLVPVARDFEYPYQYNIIFIRSTELSRHYRLRRRLAEFLSVPRPAAEPGEGAVSEAD